MNQFMSVKSSVIIGRRPCCGYPAAINLDDTTEHRKSMIRRGYMVEVWADKTEREAISEFHRIRRETTCECEKKTKDVARMTEETRLEAIEALMAVMQELQDDGKAAEVENWIEMLQEWWNE